MNGLSRRHFLHLGAGAVGAAAVYGHSVAAGASTLRRTAPYRPYVAGSYFKSGVAGAAVDSARTSAFRAFMADHPDQADFPHPRINGIGENQWGTVFAKGNRNSPSWRLTGNVTGKAAFLATTGFRAPEWLGDMFTGTADSPFAVLDRASNVTVFGTGAQVVGERLISVTSAGVTYHGSNGLDYRNPASDDSRNSTSRGRISDAMVIRKDLVEWGVNHGTSLQHVLHLFSVETDSAAGFAHPMVGAESDKFGFGAEGERIAIAGSVDVAARGLSAGGLVIARTLQDYGCYFGDNSGSSSALKAEQEQSVRPGWDGLLTQDCLEGLTWDDFVVLA